MRVCDSCYEEYGPKEGEGAPGAETSPMKTKKEALDSDLPAEYLASPLAQQVCLQSEQSRITGQFILMFNFRDLEGVLLGLFVETSCNLMSTYTKELKLQDLRYFTLDVAIFS